MFASPPPLRALSGVLRVRGRASTALCFVLCAFFGQPCANDRPAFLAAERALEANDIETFDRLSAGLADYPLYPYLRFAFLTRDLEATSDADIERFLGDYPQTQLATRLRLAYLARLAAAERWSDYARIYRPDRATERRCLYLRSLIETGRRDEALAGVEPLWLSARSQPDACDPVFAAWRDAGGLTTERILQRVRLAMEAGERGVAGYLGGLLPDAQKHRYAAWRAVDADPALVLDPGSVEDGHPQRAAILAHGLARLAPGSPETTADALASLADVLSTDGAASDRAHAAIGQALTRAGDPRGLAVWDGVRATERTMTEQEARLRAAVALRAWERVSQWVARMPEGAVKRDRWLYWQGRAEAELGRDAAAHATLKRAAEGRSLWAFLAADRLGLPYRLDHAGTPAEPERIRALASGPTFARMRELSRLGRETDMRREWRELMEHLDGPDLLAAAYVADVMRWHDQAIQASARSGYWDDMELRFPTPYRALVEEQAWQRSVEPDWILAVIRQESVFAGTLASHAGAVGLMQLLPTTAREVAQTLDLDPPSRWDLLDPSVNIALGSAYLTRMRDRFGHAALATAAYNAGPARVARWLPDACLEADLWILSIPFLETRRYVERVLAYRVIYGERLGLPPTRLSDWLPPVPGADFFES
ncbi:transglycosylase SLT domain-containing protein [Thiocapsa marina]|uniref:Lytic transglycosylase catalytic n=1 Tax=Thiocapsa marina 5811 TaxID=768671 RepID=F9UB26_9GAMM|nr:transglycosylase SLT domain-containing protein [Thiocapsa marina]EGV18644.1 Lytic transglycosylase catalytic [Thiocapsa marina 5811]